MCVCNGQVIVCVCKRRVIVCVCKGREIVCVCKGRVNILVSIDEKLDWEWGRCPGVGSGDRRRGPGDFGRSGGRGPEMVEVVVGRQA